MTTRRFDFDEASERNAPLANGGAGAVERGSHVRELWNFVRRNRRLMLVVPLVVLATALLAMRMVRPVYEAATTIRIDEERSNVPVLDMLRTLSSGSGIGTEMQVLRSRTLAEDVVDSLRLAVRLQAPRQHARDELVHVTRASRTAPRGRYELTRRSDGAFDVRHAGGTGSPVRIAVGERFDGDGVSFELRPAAREVERLELRVERYDDVVRTLRRRFAVARPSRDADIVEVRYQDVDRLLVAAVPNVLADRFIAMRNRDHSRQSQSTVRFLEEQIAAIAAQLRNAEGELQHFREGTGVISIEAEARASIAGLGELKADRDGLAAEAAALERVLAELGGDVADRPAQERRALAFPTLLRIPATSQLLMTLSELEDQRARTLMEYRASDPRVASIHERIREVEQQIAAIVATYVGGLRQQVASLDATLARFRGELQQVPARELTFARLRREASVLEDMYTMLQTRLKEQEVLAAIEDAAVRVIDDALVPRRPVRPNVPLTIGLALLVGGVLGVGAGFVREQIDTAVHTREDLQRAAPGVALLGTIPRIRVAGARANGGRSARRAGARQEDGVARMIAAFDPQHPVAEAYRSLRTSISFSRAGAPPKTLVFTSPVPGDGKSTSAANFAVTLARQGGRCVLIDADLRRGGLHRAFGIAQEPGLSNVLLGRAELEAALVQVRVGDVELALLPAGVSPPNPAELVGSEAMPALLEKLCARYDAVIIDAPPLNLVTDAALLGVHADGVVLVARAGATDRAAVTYAIEQLRAVRARVLGSVLNGVGDGRERYYGSYVPDAKEYAGG
jgi:capsular exopolysaccharide synthesis family protein